MSRLVYDSVQLLGLGLIAAGIARLFGWACAAIAVGALLIAITMIEALVFGRRG